MSAALELLLRVARDPQRLRDIRANEAAMQIVTTDEPGLEVVEVWHTPDVAMEATGETE